MTKTAAERQADLRYRKQQTGDGEKKLSMWVSTSCAFAIARLAKRSGVSKRELFMKLVADADTAVIKNIDIDTPEWDEYMKI